MITKHIRTTGIAILGAITSAVASPTSKFQQDREVILAMSGAYEVHFSFKEVYPISPGYELRKDYNENAKELVKVVEDTEKQIVLQHLLVVGTGEDTTIIKHWSQIWTFEDTVLLEYDREEIWHSKKIASEITQGAWSQLVTQTDDSPRYESYGIWVHSADSSEWVSQTTRRPLPRREYTKRSDYQVLLAENRHIVTASGWSHFQLNRKRVENDGEASDLCIEFGLNIYSKTEPESLPAAEDWWQENQVFWKPVALAWRRVADSGSGVNLRPENQGKTFGRVLKNLRRNATGGNEVSLEQVSDSIAPFILK